VSRKGFAVAEWVRQVPGGECRREASGAAGQVANGATFKAAFEADFAITQ